VINIYNIVIFGTGSAAEKLSESLNDNVNVVCYMDNNKLKWGNKFNKKLVVNPSEIYNINYDYIIIASQFNSDIFMQLIRCNVPTNKIFEYINFIHNMYNPFEYKMSLFERNILDYKSIITGISYIVSGISGDVLKKKGINFAFDSQDLYYDYSIVKYILKKYRTNIKYAIIGLSYYAFQYDLSLSSMKDNVKLYYPILNKSHNLHMNTEENNRIIINKVIANKVLKISNNGEFILSNKTIPLSEYTTELEYIGKKQAALDCNKNYPNTVAENKYIFSRYIELLKKNNIKPIVVVCPTSKYYHRNFSKRIKNEFFEIINEIRKMYSFQYIDYFDSNLFDDSMFYDVSHLTYEGGKIFTEILNEIIEW
jgi:hypothetical protein